MLEQEPLRAAEENSGHTCTFGHKQNQDNQKNHKEQNIRTAEYATSETQLTRGKSSGEKKGCKNNSTELGGDSDEHTLLGSTRDSAEHTGWGAHTVREHTLLGSTQDSAEHTLLGEQKNKNTTTPTKTL